MSCGLTCEEFYGIIQIMIKLHWEEYDEIRDEWRKHEGTSWSRYCFKRDVWDVLEPEQADRRRREVLNYSSMPGTETSISFLTNRGNERENWWQEKYCYCTGAVTKFSDDYLKKMQEAADAQNFQRLKKMQALKETEENRTKNLNDIAENKMIEISGQEYGTIRSVCKLRGGCESTLRTCNTETFSYSAQPGTVTKFEVYPLVKGDKTAPVYLKTAVTDITELLDRYSK